MDIALQITTLKKEISQLESRIKIDSENLKSFKRALKDFEKVEAQVAQIQLPSTEKKPL